MKRSYVKHKPTEFFLKWGYECNEIAEMERTTPEAIRIRVKKYGDPFYKPITQFEKKWGKSAVEFANELGISHIAVYNRVNRLGTPYLNDHQKTKEEQHS